MSNPKSYLRYTSKMNLDKAIHTLEGILKGIAIDSKISETEVRELGNWLNLHADVAHQHPFSEIMPVLVNALKDGIISEDEHKDLLWVCGNLQSTSTYYDSITSDMQRLHGIIHGLLADCVLTDEEIRKLADWISENDHLKGCYPFDEIDSVLTSILSDGKIDDHERQQLQAFIQEFAPTGKVANNASDSKNLSASGICATCPSIIFEDMSFCLTGESQKASREELNQKIESSGGKIVAGVRKDLNYLIVCSGGNPCWAFSCYGRKVEKAIDYRKQGSRIVIAHENDFWDAMADRGQ